MFGFGVFKRLFQKKIDINYCNREVDDKLLLIIHKNCDPKTQTMLIKRLVTEKLWLKHTGSAWNYKMGFNKYLQVSNVFDWIDKKRAGRHEVKIKDDLITKQRVILLLEGERQKLGKKLFQLAARTDRFEDFKNHIEMTKKDGHKKLLKDFEQKGERLIHFATMKNNAKVLRYLITKENFDPNQLNKLGETPLFHAVKLRNGTCLEMLVKEFKVKMDMRDDIGIMPVFYAIKSNKLEYVKLLLTEDNINQFLAEDTYTPLQLSCQWGHVELSKWMVLHFKNIDLFKQDHKGKIAVDFAKKEDLKEFLLHEMEKREPYQKDSSIIVIEEGEEEEEKKEEKKDNETKKDIKNKEDEKGELLLNFDEAKNTKNNEEKSNKKKESETDTETDYTETDYTETEYDSEETEDDETPKTVKTKNKGKYEKNILFEKEEIKVNSKQKTPKNHLIEKKIRTNSNGKIQINTKKVKITDEYTSESEDDSEEEEEGESDSDDEIILGQ